MEIQSENEPLRKYLNRITMQLMFGVGIPRAERLTIRQELTQHLSAMIEDEIAEGASLEEATAAALRRFGNPRKVGKAIRKKWLHSHKGFKPLTPKRQRLRTICAFLFVMLVVHGFDCLFPAFIDAHRQTSISLAIFHAAVCGIVMVFYIGAFFALSGFLNEKPSDPNQEFSGSPEEWAKTFAEEFGERFTQEKVERSRSLEGKIKRGMNVISIVFIAVPIIALIYVVLSPTLSYADKLPWCYDITKSMFAILSGVPLGLFFSWQRSHKAKAA